eukprot:11252667-Ditylum_brightwellii.AAC.1
MCATVVSNFLSFLKEELVVWLWSSGGASIKEKYRLVAVEMGMTEPVVTGIGMEGLAHILHILH